MRSFTDLAYQRKRFAPPASDTIDARVLAAGVSETFAVHAGGKYVIFSSTADFYVKYGTDNTVVAAVPGADLTAGTGSELNPEAREIPADITWLAIVSPYACNVTLSWYL